jgi:hypothetical protein
VTWITTTIIVYPSRRAGHFVFRTWNMPRVTKALCRGMSEFLKAPTTSTCLNMAAAVKARKHGAHFPICWHKTLISAVRYSSSLLPRCLSRFWILLTPGERLKTRFLENKYISQTIHKFIKSTVKHGARGGAICWGTALQVGRSRVWFPMVTLEFLIYLIHPTALWIWDWFRNKYQEYFLGVKTAGA